MVEHVLVVRGQGKVLLLMQKTQMLWLGDNKNSSLLTAGPAKPGGGGGGGEVGVRFRSDTPTLLSFICGL